MSKETYYQILEISQDAAYDEVKRAYRRLVKIYHPDLNPSKDAAIRIQLITEAYEVLADPSKRQTYDWSLLQNLPYENKIDEAPQPELDEREVFKQEYVRWKRRKDQESWEHLFKIKLTFYKYQRYMAVVFLGFGLLFSIDHYVSQKDGPYEVANVALNRFGTTTVVLGNRGYIVSSSLHQDLNGIKPNEGYLYRSFIFKRLAYVSVDLGDRYPLYDSLYIFHNFFAFLIIFISLLMIKIRKYQDWLLTLGLVPGFLLAFLFLMTLLP